MTVLQMAQVEHTAAEALCLRDLSVSYGRTEILRNVSLSVGAGECFGLVGESGCGKSTAAFAAMRALPRAGRITGGSVTMDGQDVLALSRGALRQLWARRVSMVYQDPSRALNPTITVGAQLMEAFAVLGVQDARGRAEAMLAKVQIPSPARVMGVYPHQLSGGTQQRVVIAMALAKNPVLLVMDEPTTGLDATVEAEIMDLVELLRREQGTAILLISHNLPLVGRMCDRIGVLYAGSLVEQGPAADVLHAPRHPRACFPACRAAGSARSRGRCRPLPASCRRREAGWMRAYLLRAAIGRRSCAGAWRRWRGMWAAIWRRAISSRPSPLRPMRCRSRRFWRGCVRRRCWKPFT